MLYKSFAITVRPRLGLHGDLAHAIEKWFRKHTYYAFVYELEEEARHVHGQIWLDEATSLDNIRKAIYRILKKHLELTGEWTPAVQKVQAGGIKIAYNDDFVNHYMTKDGKVESHAPTDTSIYYPTPEQQALAMAKASRVADPYYNGLRDRWNASFPEYIEHQFTDVDIAEFYYNQMFTDKIIPVISDPRQRKQKANALFHYVFPNPADRTAVISQERYDIYKLLKDSIQ